MTDTMSIMIPKEVENMQLPDPELKNFYCDLQHRTFWLDDEVAPYLLELVKYVIQWNEEDKNKKIEDRTPIRIFFFSPGGDLDINYTLIDAITMSKTPVIGINVGQCASAAAYIFLSCHKRYMFPHAHFLFHQGGGALNGTFEQIRSSMADYQNQVDELSSFIIEHTNYSKEEVSQKITGEWYVRKEEALKHGIVNDVITDIDMLDNKYEPFIVDLEKEEDAND